MKSRKIKNLTEPQVRCAFHHFNREYFDDSLPMPDIELMHSFKYFGRFTSDIEDDTTVNPLIRISDQYEYTESQLRDILVHEMIHYYLAYNGIDVDGTHGKEFQKLAKKFNKQYKMHISEIIDMSKYTRREGTSWIKYSLAKLF
jgi:hypothetical protein